MVYVLYGHASDPVVCSQMMKMLLLGPRQGLSVLPQMRLVGSQPWTLPLKSQAARKTESELLKHRNAERPFG